MPDAGADAALPSCAQMRWPAMLAEPIVPPRRFAGLDLAGDDTWRGLTIEEAQQTNCPATTIDATNAAWGSLNEVEVQFDSDSRKINGVILHEEYSGTLTFKDRAGAHTYTIQLGHPIQKDGANFAIDWTTTSSRDAQLTELFNALMGPNGPGA